MITNRLNICEIQEHAQQRIANAIDARKVQIAQDLLQEATNLEQRLEGLKGEYLKMLATSDAEFVKEYKHYPA